MMNKVPNGWSLSIVDDLFDVQLGKMLNQEAKAKYPQFAYLTNFNVRWGSFSTDNFNTMYFSEKERLKFSLQHGDLIMCEGGEVGRCAIWENQVTPCYFQKALHRLRSKGEIIPKYFQLYMVFISDKKLLEDYISRTSIAHLTREKLLTLPVKLPPLPEQIKIAEILSTWDNAINTVQKLLANSQQQKEALMQQLLTGKKRFAGFEGEWEEKRLGDLGCTFTGLSGKTKDDFGVGSPYITYMGSSQERVFIILCQGNLDFHDAIKTAMKMNG